MTGRLRDAPLSFAVPTLKTSQVLLPWSCVGRKRVAQDAAIEEVRSRAAHDNIDLAQAKWSP